MKNIEESRIEEILSEIRKEFPKVNLSIVSDEEIDFLKNKIKEKSKIRKHFWMF